MKHEKEWHTCDRCGRRIKDYEMIAFSNHPGGVRKYSETFSTRKQGKKWLRYMQRQQEGHVDTYLTGIWRGKRFCAWRLWNITIAKAERFIYAVNAGKHLRGF